MNKSDEIEKIMQIGELYLTHNDQKATDLLRKLLIRAFSAGEVYQMKGTLRDQRAIRTELALLRMAKKEAEEKINKN